MDPKIDRAARELDLHYIPSRYPDAFPSGTPFEYYDRAKGEEALGWAGAILAFVKRNLKT
ncbi:MAG: HEPN domain-containing protein [Actinobacteria bacterium]|nr:HEPN domain-containing protein [Actinomycetota bacterium]